MLNLVTAGATATGAGGNPLNPVLTVSEMSFLKLSCLVKFSVGSTSRSPKAAKGQVPAEPGPLDKYGPVLHDLP